MFKRASEALKENRVSFSSFEIRFVVYRNDNSLEDRIFQSSSWETNPHELRKFMNTIQCEEGWINEAIEIGLWHANRENERERITQVILVGDAPPNSEAEITDKRNSKKCGWQKHRRCFRWSISQ